MTILSLARIAVTTLVIATTVNGDNPAANNVSLEQTDPSLLLFFTLSRHYFCRLGT